MNDQLQQIQQQINELHAQRVAIIKDEVDKHREALKDLKWLKNHKVKFIRHELVAAGLPAYSLTFYSNDKCLEDASLGHSDCMCLFGANRHYQDNITLSKGDFMRDPDVYKMYTSNPQTLAEFIKRSGVVIDLGDDRLVFKTVLEHST